jgi:hypothetical protein
MNNSGDAGEGGFISVDGFDSAFLKLVLEFLQFFASFGFRQTILFEFFLLPGILIDGGESGNPPLSFLVKKIYPVADFMGFPFS